MKRPPEGGLFIYFLRTSRTTKNTTVLAMLMWITILTVIPISCDGHFLHLGDLVWHGLACQLKNALLLLPIVSWSASQPGKIMPWPLTSSKSGVLTLIDGMDNGSRVKAGLLLCPSGPYSVGVRWLVGRR